MDTIYSSLLPMTSAPYLHCIGDAHVIKADFSLGLSGVFNAQTSPFPKHFSLGFPIITRLIVWSFCNKYKHQIILLYTERSFHLNRVLKDE